MRILHKTSHLSMLRKSRNILVNIFNKKSEPMTYCLIFLFFHIMNILKANMVVCHGFTMW